MKITFEEVWLSEQASVELGEDRASWSTKLGLSISWRRPGKETLIYKRPDGSPLWRSWSRRAKSTRKYRASQGNTAAAAAWGQEGTSGSRRKLWRAGQKDGRNFDEKDKPRWGARPVLTAALLSVAKTWKQPQCLLTEAWIKKKMYIDTMQ